MRILKLLAVMFAGLFISWPAAGASWKWIAYGDTRTDDAAHRSVLQAIQKNSSDYQFIINVGDVVADGSDSAQWDIWQKACDDILGGTGQTRVPPGYMAVPGNHDAVPGRGLANWNAYLGGQVQYGNSGKYFTFDYENARFILLNSEEANSRAQQAMLLQAVRNNPKDWLFVVWHVPMFDFGPKHYEAGLHTDWGVPLYQNGCDLIINGHDHYYVRSKKLNLNGQLNPPLDPAHGTVQLVAGNGGAPLYTVDENHDGNAYMLDYSYDQSQPGYYGYTEITVDGRQASLRHIRSDGAVMDTAAYSANPKPAVSAPAAVDIRPHR